MLSTLYESDTIAAISTPPGKGGISIVKISGPDAVRILKTIFSGSKNPETHERTMVYGHVIFNNEKIDQVLSCVMKSPRSYTGEDVVEIHSHGGYAAAEAILAIALREGARIAGPGEFTKRAFLNGKIDLAQAEGVMEIISAENREHLKQAEHLLDGTFSLQIEHLLSDLKTSESLLEFNIDFHEHDTEEVKKNDIKKSIQKTIKSLNGLISSYKTGEKIKHGPIVILAGRVNSGKSSLFNTLLGKKRAIVNTKEGTTRDWIEDKIELDGISINIIDTAGLRFTDDEIEYEGVQETKKLLKKADLVVYLHDPEEIVPPLPDLIPETPNYIHILSKSDLVERKNHYTELLPVSSVTLDGIPALQSRIARKLKSLLITTNSNFPVMIERHNNELKKAKKNLTHALKSIETWSEEIISFELKEAEKHLAAVTGQHIDIDVLDEIFSRFCVGK